MSVSATDHPPSRSPPTASPSRAPTASSGPGFEPDGSWYRGVRAREEAARGLNAVEDLWYAGRFAAELDQGEAAEVAAWAGDLASSPPTATAIIAGAADRARVVIAAAGAEDEAGAQLALAADQLVVEGPTVVAGYPWFGDWSRDTMTSYEGLLLATGRVDEGRRLLLRAAESLSEGMLANTADAGGTEYNTVDGTLWFLHAVDRHVALTGDDDLAAALADDLLGIVDHHLAGTRFGIRVDPEDGLLTQGADGWALTWMDARVDGRPITPRSGKPVEVNALWINGLAAIAGLLTRVGRDSATVAAAEAQARASFPTRFRSSGRAGLADVLDGPSGDDWSVRPNQLLAASLPHGPLADATVVAACGPLVTSLGLRSLAPIRSPLPQPPPRRAGRTGRGLPPGDGVAVADRALRRGGAAHGRQRGRSARRTGGPPRRVGPGLGVGDGRRPCPAPDDRLPVPGLVGGRADPGPEPRAQLLAGRAPAGLQASLPGPRVLRVLRRQRARAEADRREGVDHHRQLLGGGLADGGLHAPRLRTVHEAGRVQGDRPGLRHQSPCGS